MKDEYNIYQNSYGMGIKCENCDKFSHLFSDCPYIRYVPRKDKIIKYY